MLKTLNIVYDDDTMCIVDKPSGLLSVPGKGEAGKDSVVSRSKERFPGIIDQPAVHRLDMDTSGLLILAKTKEAHRTLSIQFQEGKVQKYYEAILSGKIEQGRGVIRLPFRLDIDDRPRQIYDKIHGKWGVTEWELIRYEGEYSRVGFTPTTGRTHQLRVHSAHPLGLGFPIVGDALYGGHSKHGELKLHATKLTIQHPDSGELLESYSATTRFLLVIVFVSAATTTTAVVATTSATAGVVVFSWTSFVNF